VFRDTFHQMWGVLLVGIFIFGLAFILLAPILGWIGVTLSGSNTSTNSLLGWCRLSRLLGFPVLLLPSMNSVEPRSASMHRLLIFHTRFPRTLGDDGTARPVMDIMLIIQVYIGIPVRPRNGAAFRRQGTRQRKGLGSQGMPWVLVFDPKYASEERGEQGTVA
jgi:hypothetical protein